MGQADPILTRLGASSSVKKCVETALALSSSTDPQQRNHAYSFMESAIRELEDGQNRNADAGLGPVVDDGIAAPKLSEENNHDAVSKVFEEEEDKDDKENKIHEEVLDNHNNGPREDGSEQSTENVAPYAGEGVDTTNGEKPMQDMDDTVNQWSETNGMIVPGLPPVPEMNGGMNGGAMNGGMNGGGMMPGLAPDIAQEMGRNMPPPPPMDTNQMMRQMQYTVRHEVRNYDKKVVAPLMQHLKEQNQMIRAQRESIKEQKNAIKQLSLELRETKTNSGNMKLDLDTMKQNATASFRETQQSPPIQGFPGVDNSAASSVAIQPLPNYQRAKIAVARSEIEQMDKILNSNKNTIYN